MLIACAMSASFSRTPSLSPFGELRNASTTTLAPTTVSTLSGIGTETGVFVASSVCSVTELTAIAFALANAFSCANVTIVETPVGAGLRTAMPPWAVPNIEALLDRQPPAQIV